VAVNATISLFMDFESSRYKCDLEMIAYRRMMRISRTKHRTNQSILDELSPSHRFLTTIQRRT